MTFLQHFLNAMINFFFKYIFFISLMIQSLYNLINVFIKKIKIFI